MIKKKIRYLYDIEEEIEDNKIINKGENKITDNEDNNINNENNIDNNKNKEKNTKEGRRKK